MHGGRHRGTGEGGAYTLFGDLWSLEFSSGDWREISPSADPSGRFDHSLVGLADGLIVYGGNRSTGADVDALDDVWRLDFLTDLWERLEPTGGPGPRHQHATAARPGGQTLYIFGGSDGTGGSALSDLWSLSFDPLTWTELHDGAPEAPSRRVGAGLVYDPEQDRLLLFGGRDDGSLGYRNDLWAFDLSARSWRSLAAGDRIGSGETACGRDDSAVAPDLSAPERRAFGVAVRGADSELLIFGGVTECGQIDDVWRWPVGGPWSRMRGATSGLTCARQGLECTLLCPGGDRR
jgi:hypothetical protein